MFGAGNYDLAIDIENVFEVVAREAACHRSQIEEWIPWVGRHKMDAPKTFEEWKRVLRARFDRHNRQLGIASANAFETFAVTAWGAIPAFEQLLADFPGIDRKMSQLDRLRERLAVWAES